ncbi:hypothetical protein, partial [Cetobacterium sp.]|uniref:hypothetical protein n=1 Tax=Cetobacterium sp. TaxID=2071632 RepID=UPI002FCA8F40
MKKTMSKKAKIVVAVATVVVITGGAFTYKTLAEQKTETKVASMKQEEKGFESKINKLVLGDKEKEYENLLNQYNASVKNKDFIKAENLKKQINELITNLEKSNLSELDTKIENFKKLDISKLDDNAKKDIESKLTLIDNLKSQKDFKSAFAEIDGLTQNTEKLIKEQQESEQKKQEEEQKKQENKDVNSEESSNNGGSSSSNSGVSSNNGGSSSSSPYENGSVESYIAQSPTAQYTDQIIGVVASGSSAQVYLLEKNNRVWQTVLQTSGLVGSQGVGQASEYVSRTPKGSYGLGFAFGTGGNPGTNLPYRQITNNSYWISDVNSPYYNTWQEGDFGGNGNEHLIFYNRQAHHYIHLPLPI